MNFEKCRMIGAFSERVGRRQKARKLFKELIPVTGRWPMKSEMSFRVLMSLNLNLANFLNNSRNCNISVGIKCKSEWIAFFNLFICARSSSVISFYEASKYLKNRLGIFKLSLSDALSLASMACLRCYSYFSFEMNCDGNEFGKMIIQAGNTNSEPGITRKKEKGINFMTSRRTLTYLE